MSDKSPNEIQKPDCCGQGECCSSSTANKRQWWKIAVFALGIVLIVAGVTYSLITRHSAASNAPLGQGTVPAIGSGASQSACVLLGIGELTWAKNLDSIFAGSDYVFVILPKDDDDSYKAVASQVAGAADRIRTGGTSVSSMTLSPSDPELAITADRLAIKQLPAVLIMSKNGIGAVVTGDFDETKLLQTYVVLSKQSICPPGSASG
jgi:hypothetical protein